MKHNHSMKDCIGQFFNFSHKNIYDKISFDVALLVQKKNKMQAGYAELSIK